MQIVIESLFIVWILTEAMTIHERIDITLFGINDDAISCMIFKGMIRRESLIVLWKCLF